MAMAEKKMKERRVVMKERETPGALAYNTTVWPSPYWADCIPKRDVYIYIQTYNFDTVLQSSDYLPHAKALGNNGRNIDF